jgi:hypothetical protein
VHIRETVSRWLDQQSPYALVGPSNPVFNFELRRLKEPVREGDGKDYQGSLILTLFLVSVIALLFPGIRLLGVLLIPISVIVALVADVHYIIVTVGSIGPQLSNGEWDMLRLTPLRSKDILMAKYAAAQIRAWHVMFVDLTLRIATITLIVIVLVSSLMSRSFLQDVFNGSTLALLLFYGILATVYILEPLWRMRAIVALSLAISARFHDSAVATLTGFAALLLMRLSQLVLLLLTGFIFLPVEVFLTSWERSFQSIDLINLFAYLGVLLFSAGAAYAFYKLLEEGALRRALWFAFRIE